MTNNNGKVKTGRGFFLCYRSVFDHPLFDGNACYVGAWMSLISMAAYEPRSETVGDQTIDLHRGQLIGGRIKLAQKWGWTEKKVRYFLGQLKSHNMIILGHSKGRLANVITICNYGKFQLLGDAQGPVKGPDEGPVEGPLLNEVINKIPNEVSTREQMLDFVEREMGGHCRSNATQWLAKTIQQYGDDQVTAAWFEMQRRLSGTQRTIANALPYWCRTAAKIDISKTPETNSKAAGDMLAMIDRMTGGQANA